MSCHVWYICCWLSHLKGLWHSYHINGTSRRPPRIVCKIPKANENDYNLTWLDRFSHMVHQGQLKKKKIKWLQTLKVKDQEAYKVKRSCLATEAELWKNIIHFLLHHQQSYSILCLENEGKVCRPLFVQEVTICSGPDTVLGVSRQARGIKTWTKSTGRGRHAAQGSERELCRQRPMVE